ncbi:nitroreductase family protein [Candidatus Woesearchaeota archaeon]|nr:nitroreductase family protein [Candidatus Woesearchaeota archaeon]
MDEETKKQTPSKDEYSAAKSEFPETGLFEAILNRRTCRRFTDQAVEFEKVAQCIQAGMEAPSAGNLQNWQFIIITDKEKLHALYNHTMEQEVFMTASIGVLVCSDDDIAQKYYGLRGKRLYAVQNCAACIENMLLAAQAFGLGACWVGAFDEEKVDMMFQIPSHVRAQAIILFGYPEKEPSPKERKQIDHLVFFNKYGERLKRPHLMMRDYSEEWRIRINDMRRRLEKVKKKFPSTDAVSEKSKDFFDNARGRLDKAMTNLKDEDRTKKRGK